jgi:AraC family transcriptional regulator
MLLDAVMDPVAKAIWFIEFHTADPIDLNAIAQTAGLSRFHLTRAFGQVTGLSVMRYLKGRRLTEAARALAKGAPDILTVALDAGYGSHEAFTRAFREQFGVTPESIRAQARLDGLKLVLAFRRDQTMNVTIAAPRIEEGELLLVAGFSERIGYDDIASIPQLWQKLSPHIGNVPNEIPGCAYGVKFNSDNDGFEYLAGVAVSSFEGLDEFRTARIPAQTYAVFTHRGHISTIRETMKAIWNEYLPQSGLKLIDAPEYESYGRISFDPRTGNGNVDIFIPIQASRASVR